MRIDLPYGETTISAELPAGTRVLSNVERAALPPVDDLDGAVRAALAAPRGLPRIGALARPGATVTIAFDDHTNYIRGFHPIHGILATHPLRRLRHVGRVIVAAPRDPHVPRHLGFEVAASVEEAVARAQRIHSPDCTIAYVEQPPLTG